MVCEQRLGNPYCSLLTDPLWLQNTVLSTSTTTGWPSALHQTRTLCREAPPSSNPSMAPRSGAPQYLLADGCASAALRLLVSLGQGSVAGAQTLAGGIVNLPAAAFHVAVREPRQRVRQLLLSQE